MIFRLREGVLSLVCVSILVGCAGRLPRVEALNTPKERVCRVALIPFKNETSNPVISRVFYRILLSKLVTEAKLDVVEEGAVRSFMMYEYILPGSSFNLDMLRLLRRRTGVQAVIGGRILEATEGKNVKLSFFMWVRDTKTGRVLWSVYHSRTGEDYQKILHFGKISILSRLADRMLDEVIRRLKQKGFKGCY